MILFIFLLVAFIGSIIIFVFADTNILPNMLPKKMQRIINIIVVSPVFNISFGLIFICLIGWTLYYFNDFFSICWNWIVKFVELITK